MAIAHAEKTIATPKIRHTECFIDGKWRPSVSGKTFATLNPATEEVICQIAEGDKEDIDLAVQAARRAFDQGPWSRMDARDRGKLMYRLADLIAEHLVERIQADDPFASIGIEVAVHRNLVLVTGYLAVGGLLPVKLDPRRGGDEWLQDEVERAVERAGYGGRWSLPVTVTSDLVVDERTADITEGQGFSGDQDVVVGYATPDDPLGNLPVEVVAARAARARLCEVQLEHADLVGPDGKVLVVLRPTPAGAEVEALNEIAREAGLKPFDIATLPIA
jgi:hypothetical protein